MYIAALAITVSIFSFVLISMFVSVAEGRSRAYAKQLADRSAEVAAKRRHDGLAAQNLRT